MEVIDLDIALETCIERVAKRNEEIKAGNGGHCRNCTVGPEVVEDIYNTWFKDGLFPPLTVKRDYLTHKVGV